MMLTMLTMDRFSEEIPLPWAGKVYDFDASSGDALLEGRAQMFAGYYNFNIRTKQRKRARLCPG